MLCLGIKASILVEGEDTQGQFAIIETEERKGFEPPPHIHTREDEAFYVLEGEITYYVADKVIHATPGTYVYAPRGIEHTFKLNTEQAKVLVSVYPSGFEKFVKELSVPVPEQLPPVPDGPPDAEEVQKLISIAAKYGIKINIEPINNSYVLSKGLEKAIWFLGTLIEIKATGKETGGTFGLIEELNPPVEGPPLHIHHNEDETFYILEGEVTFYCGEKTINAKPGAYVFLPRGIPHKYKVEGNQPARMLTIMFLLGLNSFLLNLEHLHKN